MQFSVGDKVVHPHHGPGRVSSVERRELMDGMKRYYVIEIPRHALTVHVPMDKADELGLRPAIALSNLPRVLNTLRGKPNLLPKDFKERQERTTARLETGRVMQLARVVRDLSWHRERAYLTRTDFAHLKRGRDRLASEMALVSGDAVADTGNLIDLTMNTAVAGALT